MTKSYNLVTYPVIIQELELDLNVGSQLLEFLLLLIESELSLRQSELVELSISSRAVELKVCSVGVVLDPGCLVHLDSGKRVLHGLVDDGVDGAYKEVQRSEELLSILSEVSLRFCIEQELLLELR